MNEPEHENCSQRPQHRNMRKFAVQVLNLIIGDKVKLKN